MSVWESYERMADVRGTDRRDISLKRERLFLERKLPWSLSYFDVTIDDIGQRVAIINSDNYDEKTVISMPGEDIRHGGLVYWMDHYWLVAEKDANTEVYAKGKLLECNYLLKWIDDQHVIREQWCNVEDGTKYLTGDYGDRDFFTTRGDSRIAITLPRNEHTRKLNRTYRFLIDDINDGDQMLAFTLSKPLKIGHSYDEENGVYKFVLHEVNSTDNDNFELGIADYYLHFTKDGRLIEDEADDGSEFNGDPSEDPSVPPEPAEEPAAEERKRWI